MNSDGIILPGVGAFCEGMKNLNYYNLKPVLDSFIKTDKPLLGICLGMQILFESSDEFGYSEGLGYIEGKVKKLKTLKKLPHVSWNEISFHKIDWKETILNNIHPGTDFYFVHSFVPFPVNEKNILSQTKYYDSVFCSSIKKGNIYGTQFHPEKSGTQGLKIISNFLKICKEIKYEKNKK